MITNIDVSKIEATRDQAEQISNMKFNVNFDNVKTEKENVNVAFTFTAKYEGSGASSPKEAGALKIEGTIVAKESKDKVDEISKKWKEDKTLPISFAEDILNFITFECGARGTLVAYSIGLVAPLPVSRAKLQDSKA